MRTVRRGLLPVLIGLLVAALGLGGVALAAAPTEPVTFGFATISNVSINGIPGTQLVVAPGADVSLTASWVDSHPTYCPYCIDFIPVAFQGASSPAGCLENNGRTGSSGTNTVDLGNAPTTPGAYNIVAEYMLVYYCSQDWNPANATVIAQIIVPPTTTAQCKDGAWMNFGGIFKNQGDCVSYVATGGKNPPANS